MWGSPEVIKGHGVKFEEKHNMKSTEFYKKFENGELGDSKDFVIWSGIYELQLDSKQKLSKLI